MLAIDDVIQETLGRFPEFDPAECRVTPVEKGGSDRKFYRVACGGRTMILVKYSAEKEENRHYAGIAAFLESCGVRVPRIYHHDAGEGLLWMQDLGERDLWAFRNDSWAQREPLYHAALGEAFRLHTVATERIASAGLTLQRAFDAELYTWEQQYFFEHCLAGHFRVPKAEVDRLAGLSPLREAAVRLAGRPRVLVHRDFQSQNLIVRDRSVWLIDFQGMRPGLAEYDLASLLYDPYVTIPDSARRGLLDFYAGLVRDGGGRVAGDFHETFLWCAAQRLMQALGAYGFLGLRKGRSDFLAHIPAARASLRSVAAQLDGLAPLVTMLDSLP